MVKIATITPDVLFAMPVFCPECKNRDTFVRAPKHDAVGQGTGYIYQRGYECKACGYFTIRPNPKFYKKVV